MLYGAAARARPRATPRSRDTPLHFVEWTHEIATRSAPAHSEHPSTRNVTLTRAVSVLKHCESVAAFTRSTGQHREGSRGRLRPPAQLEAVWLVNVQSGRPCFGAAAVNLPCRCVAASVAVNEDTSQHGRVHVAGSTAPAEEQGLLVDESQSATHEVAASTSATHFARTRTALVGCLRPADDGLERQAPQTPGATAIGFTSKGGGRILLDVFALRDSTKCRSARR